MSDTAMNVVFYKNVYEIISLSESNHKCIGTTFRYSHISDTQQYT